MLRRGEEGVGLVEVAMAFAVMLMVLIPVAYLLMNVLTQTGNARQKITALGIAEQWVETMNDYGPPNNAQGLPNIGNTIPVAPATTLGAPYNLNAVTTVGNVTYTASATFNWATVNASKNLCSTATVPSVLDIQVQVTWSANSSITDNTVVNYPPASLPTYGFVGVQINGDPPWQVNASGQLTSDPPNDANGITWQGASGRVQSVPITVTPVAPTTGAAVTVNPDEDNGCAFIEEPAGTYSVQVGPDPPATSTEVNTFVQPDGTTQANTPVATPVTVNVNQVSAVGPYLYDEGAFVNVLYPNTTTTEDGVVCPNAGQLQCLVTGQSPTGANPDGTSGTTATAGVLSGNSFTPGTVPSGLNISHIASTACAASNACVAVGYGSAGAAAVFDAPTAPGTWLATTGMPANISTLSQVVCPTGTVCFAIGTNTAGNAVLLTGSVVAAPSASVTWVANTLPVDPSTGGALTSLTQLVCPTSTATCFAVGSDATGPVVISGTQSSTTQTFVWDTLPNDPATSAPPTSLTQIACPASATQACLVIGKDSKGAVIISGTQSATAPAFAWDTLPNNPATSAIPTSLVQIACPTTSANACMVIGKDSKGAVVIAGTQVATAQTFVWDPLPLGPVSGKIPSSLTQIACPATSAMACLAIGKDSSGPVVIGGAQSATTQTWAADPLPAGVTSLAQLTCVPGAANTCVATGAGSSTAAIVTATIQSGAQTLGGGVYTVAAASPVFISGVACQGSGPMCEAAGSTMSGAVVLNDNNLRSNSNLSDWTVTAVPNQGGQNVPGLRAASLPIGVSNSQIPGSQFYVACAACNSSAVGPVFPFVAGDSVGAAACPSDLGGNASVQASLVPGQGGASAPAVTVPLGLLPIQVVNPNGTPAPNATVTVSVTTSGCPGTYSLTNSGADGLTRVAVIYETYTVTATLGGNTGTATVQVTPTQTIVNPAASPTFDVLPTPVQVKL